MEGEGGKKGGSGVAKREREGVQVYVHVQYILFKCTCVGT